MAQRQAPTRLFRGSHSPDGEMCVMEAVAYVAGEPWSSHPACACPILTGYCIRLNDTMGDEERQTLLPYVTRLVGTRDASKEVRRAFILADARIAGTVGNAAWNEALAALDRALEV